jgi:hypothetical protein
MALLKHGPPSPTSTAIPRRHRETLAEHIARSSPAERMRAGREIGIDVIWDTMISPIIDAERATAEKIIAAQERKTGMEGDSA